MIGGKGEVMRHLAAILCVLTLNACGKDSSSDKDAAQPATLENVVGTWKVASIRVNGTGSEIAVTGLTKYRFTSDNLYLAEQEAATYSANGEKTVENCTSYESGMFKLEAGTMIISDTVALNVSGHCASDQLVIETSSSSAEVVTADSRLQLEQNLSYQDAAGKSVVDKVVMTLEKTDDANTSFNGVWQLDNLYHEGVSCSGNSGKGTIIKSGVWQMTFNDSLYEETQTAFKIGDGEACTGTATGTILKSALLITPTQQSASDCLKDSPDKEGEVTTAERDFISPSGRYISLQATQSANAACPELDKTYFGGIFLRR